MSKQYGDKPEMADNAQDKPSAQRFTQMTRMLLDNIKRAGFPPIYTLPVEHARVAYRAGVGASELPHVPVARVETFQIRGPAGSIRARLWAASHDPEQPVLLYLHGGGFVIGGIETCESMCRALAVESGAAVVAIDYRLAPEHKYPAGLHDCWAAFTWLAEHGRSMGLDGRRIAVGGDSAGGTFSACVALMARDAGVPLALQALIYPSVQTRAATASFKAFARDTLLSAELMKWFDQHAMAPEPLAHAWHREPLHADDHRGLAPAWIGLAECDALTDEGHQYAQKLRDAGVAVELREWPGVIHDFINMGRFLPEAKALHSEMAAAVKRALLG